jgi:hypothetical protein
LKKIFQVNLFEDNYGYLKVGKRDAPDSDLARYPANPKVGYRISGEAGYLISGRIL